MAYRMLLPQPWPDPGVTTIYNIDEPVGLNCTNKRLDVMLIQVLLWAWALEGGDHLPSYPDGVMAKNGRFDNFLLAWIFHYQLMAAGSEPARITGKMVPVGKHATGDNLKNMVYLLNQRYVSPDIRREEHIRGKIWENLNFVGVPQELQDAIKTPRSG